MRWNRVWNSGEMGRVWGPHRWQTTESTNQNAPTESGDPTLEGKRYMSFVAVAGEETGRSHQWKPF